MSTPDLHALVNQPRRPLDNYFEFENLAGRTDLFDPGKAKPYWGRDVPSLDVGIDEVLYRTLHGRWVLVYVMQPIAEELGTPEPPNRELQPDQASAWLIANEHPLPDELEPCHPGHQGGLPSSCSEPAHLELQAPSPEPALEVPVVPSDIRVDVDKMIVYLNSEPFALGKKHDVLFVRCLIESRGNRVSFSAMKARHPSEFRGKNSSDIMKRIYEKAKPIHRLIGSDSKGYKLSL